VQALKIEPYQHVILIRNLAEIFGLLIFANQCLDTPQARAIESNEFKKIFEFIENVVNTHCSNTSKIAKHIDISKHWVRFVQSIGKMAGAEGFEPSAYGFVVFWSISQLIVIIAVLLIHENLGNYLGNDE